MDNAIVERLQSDSTLTAIIGNNIYNSSALANTSMPHVKFYRSKAPLPICGTTTVKEYQYVFEYCSLDSSECDSIGDKISALFHKWREDGVRSWQLDDSIIPEDPSERSWFHGQQLFRMIG